ncbi:uncharacterized protein LOC111331344 isoform X2 [Stylophora pistillata]|uniref:uncharacterized protein LOC111331344 isoform X2 n=1 Tax=Stylophora pistillata TaxID=50429 RepID=UPI000C0535F1|nr:uncharacterized protein LOC111331344 isoform X2 [Stylophora pistillata]
MQFQAFSPLTARDNGYKELTGMAQEGKGQEFNEQERRSMEFIENLSKIGWPEKDDDDCVRSQPSTLWTMIKAVNFKKDRSKNIAIVQASFTSKNSSGASYTERSTSMPSMRSGRRAHGVLNQLIRQIQGVKGGVDLEPEEKRLLQGFVENIEKHFGFKFRASELKIHGYTNKQQMDDDIRCWRGKIDAIGVMKNGTVIIVDWIVPRDENHKFWDEATKFSRKLHQTMIYREIIRAQWKDSYKCEKDIPTVGILIVPISTKGSDPRCCLDFEKLRKAGFFDDIDGLTWTAQKPRKTDKVCLELRCDKVKKKLSEAVSQKSPPDIRSEIIKQESTMKAEEVHSCKPKTLVGDCGNKMKSILERPILPYVEEIKQVQKPIAVKQEEQIRQMPDRQHLSGRTPTNSYRTAEMSEIIKQESTVKAERVEVKEEDYSRKHKTPDGDCGKRMKSILQPPIPPYVEEIKEVRNPITVKQEEQRRQMFDWQHVFGWTPADSNRTDKMSEIIKQESTVKAEGEDYLRKHKTLDGDCGNKMKSIFEPRIPLYVEEIKEVRKPIAVKHDEPIRQMPDWQHLFGRTPKDSYRTAEMCDTRNAAVGHVTQMPDLQHYIDIARTPVHRYFTPEEALQAHSSYIQSGISAAQMVYRESAELNAYHFMEKAGCSCHGRKKCAHAQGAGQCDCKAAGKKCGHYCDCDEQICTNREQMNITWHKEEDYSRNYTASDAHCGYHRYMAGCSCHGRKKCAHARGAGQCDCKAAGKKCGYNCNCDERICTNRAW